MTNQRSHGQFLVSLLAISLAVAAGRLAEAQVVNPANCTIVASATSGPAPLTVSFSHSHTNYVEGFEAAGWYFGDGTGSSVPSPTHTFTSPGTYVVTGDYYFVTPSLDFRYFTTQIGWATTTIVVSPPIDAAFSASPLSGTAPLTVAFTNTSTGQPTTWSWNFGDGSTSNLQNPSHTYTTPGNYTVSLTVTKPGAGSNAQTNQGYITVGSPPLSIANLTVCGTGVACTAANTCVVVTGSSADVCVNGTGFTASSIVRFNGIQHPTSFISPTQLGVVVSLSASSSNYRPAGTYTITVLQSGATSNGIPLTIRNPLPSISGITPTSLNAGVLASSAAITFTLGGGIFANNAVIQVNGAPIPTTTLDLFTVQGVLPESMLALPGVLALRVRNPGPGGGTSTSTLNLNVVGPAITSVGGPAFPIPVAPPSSNNLFIFGSNFSPSAVAIVNGIPKPTLVIDSGTLRFSLVASLPELQQRGAIVLNVRNPGPSGNADSNSFAVRVGSGGSNSGLIAHLPAVPVPGGYFGLTVEGGTPGQLYTLIVDSAPPPPLFPFATPTADQVLSVRPLPGGPGIWAAPVDGLGIYGPSTGAAFNAGGAHLPFSFPLPNPALGIALTLQGVFLDPAAPEGYYLTWARKIAL